MPELLKNKFYNYASLYNLAVSIKGAYPALQVDNFVSDIMDETWDTLELKSRMRKITVTLGKHLPPDYRQALGIIDNVVANFPIGFNDYSMMYFPDFVEVYGQDACDLDYSIAAIERYTPSSTAEFAVRPFIINHERRMMEQMAIWARHDNEHVRRLASEGCRPALPWGQALVRFKHDPSPIMPILELLKDDPSLYVRKSVANNLNDISKTHSDLVTRTARNWLGLSKNTDWIVKHGCRTLLKSGNRAALELFGLANSDSVNVSHFSLSSEAIAIGDTLTFSFVISAKDATKVRLEYIINFAKPNGKHNRKIFQISEVYLDKLQEKSYTKAHLFANLSTRKLYHGLHSITLIVNGTERGTLNFNLVPR